MKKTIVSAKWLHKNLNDPDLIILDTSQTKTINNCCHCGDLFICSESFKAIISQFRNNSFENQINFFSIESKS